LVKAFGDKYSLSEIDEMKVCEIRELLNNRKAIGPRVNMEGHELWYDKVDEKTWVTTTGYVVPEFEEPIEEPTEEEKNYDEFAKRMEELDRENIENLK
jgi:hypothetical protein